MISSAGYMRAAEILSKEIANELVSIGLLCRVFGRGKSPSSLVNKISSNPGKYSKDGKLIQDAVGIRVVLYFQEDLKIVESVLRRKYKCDDASSTIDKPANTTFSVSRYNLIFFTPDSCARDMAMPTNELPVDKTFEVQLRTVLSEGWHEVEHDLRYKRSADWIDSDDLSRGLNGVLATLETAEWSMRKIFDDLAYKHYKEKKWDSLINSVLRMRITAPLGEGVCAFFNSNGDAARRLVRIDRHGIFRALSALAPRVPLTANNIVFVWNRVGLRNEELESLAPTVIKEVLSQAGL
ncbi:RelA/SpoT domain-containing protein [Achromobacter xylosoxidans]|uniref:RelA/SpoT domain-containing protein n=1 Tax=Alcaligenes xylosoxydans xylosoxydans TaxID=85698 RepID=UPI00320B49D7